MRQRLLDAIREGLELGSLKRENRQMRSAIESKHNLVGSSPALGRIMDQVKRAAPTNATVLILGLLPESCHHVGRWRLTSAAKCRRGAESPEPHASRLIALPEPLCAAPPHLYRRQ